MRIDMVWSVLRVVFQHEDNSIFPVRRVGNSFHDSPEREVIVSHVCFRRWHSRTATRSVIAGEMHDLQVRQITTANKLLKLFQPNIDANLIPNVHVESRIIRTRVWLERSLHRVISNRRTVRYGFTKLTVIAQLQTFPDRRVPDKS